MSRKGGRRARANAGSRFERVDVVIGVGLMTWSPTEPVKIKWEPGSIRRVTRWAVARHSA